MKKYLSVFNLIATSSIYKITGLFGIMGVIEFFLFRMIMLAGPNENGTFHIEYVFEQSRTLWVFAAALLVLTVFLCATGYETSSKQGYTLKRLSISEKKVFALQALYNTLCYFLLWSMQLLFVFLLGFYFTNKAPEMYVTNQTLFLAFYRNNFLHGLLPFEDVIIWIKNIFLFLGLGICSAGFTMAQRKGKRAFELVILLVSTIFLFSSPLGVQERPIIALGISLACIWLTSLRVRKKEGYDEI